MKKSQNGPSGVIAVALLICLAPSALKLAGVIDRPWWLVTLPLWAVFALVVVFALALAIATIAVVALADNKAEKTRR